MSIRLGLFDSGIGGLTVLKRLQEKYSDFEVIYLADTAQMPYGSKLPSQIREIALDVTSWLIKERVDAVVVACNTTNSLALDLVKGSSDVPVFDLLNSLSFLVNDSRVGVLATPSTVLSKAYTNSIKSFNPFGFVIEEQCPEFVPIIESGDFNSAKLREIAKKHIDPLLEAKVSSVILGCSHYPLIQSIFFDLLPIDVRLIDPAIGLATKMENFLKFTDSYSNSSKSLSNTRFCVTGNPFTFSALVEKLYGERPAVEVISLRSKANVF